MWLLIKNNDYHGLPVKGGEQDLNKIGVPEWSFYRPSEEYFLCSS